jgi:hypothetical protein
VSEQFHHHSGMDALSKQQGSGRVSEVEDTHLGELGGLQ